MPNQAAIEKITFSPCSYYCVQETGLYYLQSRYYNPAWGRFISADSFLSTGQGILGNNMFAYCGNNPVNRADPSGLFYQELFEKVRDGMQKVVRTFQTLVLYLSPLDNEKKVLIATIAAEGTVTAKNQPVSSAGRQAMANVVLNRVGSREWVCYKSVAEICKESGFDGYGNANYKACMAYLDNRDGKNATYEGIIWDVMKAYVYDITGGCQLYYTPAAMTNDSGVPNWNFSLLTEVVIPGVDSYYEGRFYKYS